MVGQGGVVECDISISNVNRSASEHMQSTPQGRQSTPQGPWGLGASAGPVAADLYKGDSGRVTDPYSTVVLLNRT